MKLKEKLHIFLERSKLSNSEYLAMKEKAKKFDYMLTAISMETNAGYIPDEKTSPWVAFLLTNKNISSVGIQMIMKLSWKSPQSTMLKQEQVSPLLMVSNQIMNLERLD